MPVRKTTQAPLPDLALLHQELSTLLSRLVELDRSEPAEGPWNPPVDVFECRGKLVVLVEAPGLAPESLKVTQRDGALVVSGERRPSRPPAGTTGFLCMERPHGRFSRRVPLDVAVDVKSAEATLSRGLLTITLPRVKDRRGQETIIPIERQP